MFYLSTFFFFNDTATTEIYTLSLHDALPICWLCQNHLPDFLESPGGNAGPTSQMSQNQVTEMPKAPAELAGSIGSNRRNHLPDLPEQPAGHAGTTCRTRRNQIGRAHV